MSESLIVQVLNGLKQLKTDINEAYAKLESTPLQYLQQVSEMPEFDTGKFDKYQDQELFRNLKAECDARIQEYNALLETRQKTAALYAKADRKKKNKASFRTFENKYRLKEVEVQTQKRARKDAEQALEQEKEKSTGLEQKVSEKTKALKDEKGAHDRISGEIYSLGNRVDNARKDVCAYIDEKMQKNTDGTTAPDNAFDKEDLDYIANEVRDRIWEGLNETTQTGIEEAYPYFVKAVIQDIGDPVSFQLRRVKNLVKNSGSYYEILDELETLSKTLPVCEHSGDIEYLRKFESSMRQAFESGDIRDEIKKCALNEGFAKKSLRAVQDYALRCIEKHGDIHKNGKKIEVLFCQAPHKIKPLAE